MTTLERIGPYQILSHIATGGMGEVYRASRAGAVVALKVIKPEVMADPFLRAMFFSEAQVALLLEHDNIVRTFGVERGDGRLFLTMEHVEGLDLGRVVQTVGRTLRQPMPLAQVALVTVEALRGLDHAHRSFAPNGSPLALVHRDVSPGNILVSRRGEVKLADFGVARSSVRRHQSQVGALKGKLVYMAPEQLKGAAIDGRADVYSMGVVLYEMLTGKRPFRGTGPAIIPEVLSGAFVPPSALRKDLPVELEAMVMRAMAVHADDRFGSAGEMADELLRVAAQLGLYLSRERLGAFVAQVGDVRLSQPPPPPSGEHTVAQSPRGRRTTDGDSLPPPRS